MYGYEDYNDVTPEQILQKVTQEEIFDIVLNEKDQHFDFIARYLSPFRSDKDPGCRFEERPDGTILFVDFGEQDKKKIHRSCFRMVADFYNTSISGAIQIICNKFSLSTNSNDYSRIENGVSHTKDNSRFVRYSSDSSNGTEDSNEETIMTFRKKVFNKLDVMYWTGFLIKPEHLLEDNVFATNRFTVKKPNKPFKVINVYKYCYAIDFLHHVKIYQPFSDNYRFITNCDENDIGNIDNLPDTGEELIIHKAYKDHRLLRNLVDQLNVIWFHNEGSIPAIEILVNLTIRFKLITIFFDCDEAGVLAALKLHSIFNTIKEGCCRMIHLPTFIVTKNLNHKDISEFYNKEGRTDTIEVLKQIKLIN